MKNASCKQRKGIIKPSKETLFKVGSQNSPLYIILHLKLDPNQQVILLNFFAHKSDWKLSINGISKSFGNIKNRAVVNKTLNELVEYGYLTITPTDYIVNLTKIVEDYKKVMESRKNDPDVPALDISDIHQFTNEPDIPNNRSESEPDIPNNRSESEQEIELTNILDNQSVASVPDIPNNRSEVDVKNDEPGIPNNRVPDTSNNSLPGIPNITNNNYIQDTAKPAAPKAGGQLAAKQTIELDSQGDLKPLVSEQQNPLKGFATEMFEKRLISTNELASNKLNNKIREVYEAIKVGFENTGINLNYFHYITICGIEIILQRERNIVPKDFKDLSNKVFSSLFDSTDDTFIYAFQLGSEKNNDIQFMNSIYKKYTTEFEQPQSIKRDVQPVSGGLEKARQLIKSKYVNNQ